MNILHISRRFYPFAGGTEKYIYEISERLVKRNINCRVLTLNYDILSDRKEKLDDYDKIDGIEIFRIPGFGYYKKPIPLKIPVNLFKWADIVHLHDIRFLYETTLFFKPIFKYKIILSTHGFILHTKELQIIKNFLISFYYKPTIANFFSSVICGSKQDFKFFKGVNKRKSYLIENGIDFKKFSKIKRNPKKGKFLYFGRIDKNKGIDLLFRALSLLGNEDWELNIIGSGSAELIKNLKVLSDKLGISKKVNWMGYLSEEELFKFISEAYMCFSPSTYEGFGFTLIEAMAAGCICIANNIQPYRDAVYDKINGFLVNFSDSQSISKTIEALLISDSGKLCSISENARERAKKLDWGNKVEQIIEIYNNIK
jgi:alpha-1,3-mannosyltransferase